MLDLPIMIFLSHKYWQVIETKDKGKGIFARKEIKAGSVIGDYLGKIIKTAEYDLEQDKDGLFLMYFSDEACIYPDLTKPGIHLLNHSCNPNCWIYTHQSHTLFFALREIKPGEELTISYLLSPKDDSCKPCNHKCKCQSRFCTGTMHLTKDKYNKWQKFQNSQNKKTQTLKLKYGQNLPKLNRYPKKIPINPIYAQISTNNHE